MKLNIDSDDLDQLLERKRDYIGLQGDIFLEIANAAFLIFSVYYTSVGERDYTGLAIKIVFWILAIVDLTYVVVKAYRKKRSNYTKDMLLKDIEDLDMKERSSSIVAIANPNNPRKYLVYYDPDWNFLLFPNYGTRNNKNEEYVIDKLSRDFGISTNNISISLAGTGEEQKYATAHEEVRDYSYSFYRGTLSGIKDNDFDIDGRGYRWMTVQEMLEDPETQKNNSYIIDRVNEFC